MDSGIYQITNRETGKRYIGSAVSFKKRWWAHLGALRRGQHRNRHLQRAYDKYGEEAFGFTIFERIEDSSRLIPREQHYLDTLNPEYNIAPMASSPMLGRHHTEETRAKISEAEEGKHVSVETRAKLSKAWTPEHKQAQSNRMRQFWTPERRQAQSAAMSGQRNPSYGKHLSEETRAKISEATKGKHNHNYGKRVSNETRMKISKSQKARLRRVRGLVDTTV